MTDSLSSGTALPASTSLSVQETEKQLWDIIKSVPGLNVAYGSVRCIVYVIKKDDKESTDSAIATAKGAVQTAVITAGVVTAPVTIPLAAGGVLTGVVSKSVSDTVEILVFFVTNSEQFHGKKNDERERIFYNRIKNVKGVGALYSAVRVPVYFLKKNKQESIESGVDFVTNSGDTALHVGVSMIPNVDEQLQKLIEKTAHSAVKFLAKTIRDQTSRRHLPMEQGLKTLAKVENDCQTIMQATTATGQPEDQTLIETREDPNQSGGSFKEANLHEDEKKTGKRTLLACCCCFKRTAKRKKVHPTTDSTATTKTSKDSSSGSAGDKSHGHLIILTE